MMMYLILILLFIASPAYGQAFDPFDPPPKPPPVMAPIENPVSIMPLLYPKKITKHPVHKLSPHKERSKNPRKIDIHFLDKSVPNVPGRGRATLSPPSN